MTTTTYWQITNGDSETGNDKAINEAALLLRKGQTVAFPTETVYGLGADATQSTAVEGIFTAKGRPSDNPLIVHIADRSQLDSFTLPHAEALSRLMDAFWPGPLTVILPVRSGAVSPLVTAGLDTVGVRIPAHLTALRLLRAAAVPVAAPSANRSGKPSPTHAQHVRDDLHGRIAGLLDAGPAGVGLESTVVAYQDGALHVLRPGGITPAQLREAVPGTPVIEPPSAEAINDLSLQAPRAPGMKYRHYAPQGRMQLVAAEDPIAAAEWIAAACEAAKRRGERTGVLTYAEHREHYAGFAASIDLLQVCGSLQEPETIARELFAALRQFDQAGIGFILAEDCPAEGVGQAIMNRLYKAASNQFIHP
jgi:L-threonylcarbamoyladenylate synthase